MIFGGQGIGWRKVESCKDTHLICTLSDVQFCGLIVTGGFDVDVEMFFLFLFLC